MTTKQLIEKYRNFAPQKIKVIIFIINEKQMELPKDPMILFSFINTNLRDNYKSLDELCDDMQVNKKSLVEELESVGFEYNPSQNKFW